MRRSLSPLLALFTLALSVTAAAQTQSYLVVKGVQQGDFPAEDAVSTPLPKGEQVEVLAWRHEMRTAVDSTTGLATGKRTHQPLTITKRLGKSTPLFWKAQIGNETLTVTLQSYRKDPSTGTLAPFQVIKLTNARIVAIRSGTRESTLDVPTGFLDELEEISFSFATIEIQNLANNAVAKDSLLVK